MKWAPAKRSESCKQRSFPAHQEANLDEKFFRSEPLTFVMVVNYALEKLGIHPCPNIQFWEFWEWFGHTQMVDQHQGSVWEGTLRNSTMPATPFSKQDKKFQKLMQSVYVSPTIYACWSLTEKEDKSLPDGKARERERDTHTHTHSKAQ